MLRSHVRRPRKVMAVSTERPSKSSASGFIARRTARMRLMPAWVRRSGSYGRPVWRSRYGRGGWDDERQGCFRSRRSGCSRQSRKDPTNRCGPVVRGTNVRDGGAATAASQHQCVKRSAAMRESRAALGTSGGGARAHELPRSHDRWCRASLLSSAYCGWRSVGG